MRQTILTSMISKRATEIRWGLLSARKAVVAPLKPSGLERP
jgi:hypothetical protein